MDGMLVPVLMVLCSVHIVYSKAADKPVDLTEDNWKQILEGEWMVEL